MLDSIVFQVLGVFLVCSLCDKAAEGRLDLSPPTCPNNSTSVLRYTNSSTRLIVGDVRLDLMPLSRPEAPEDTNSTSSLFIDTSGSYFLPSPVDGRLTNIKVFGIGSDEALAADDSGTTVRFYVKAMVYRPDDSNMAYRLLHGPTLVTHKTSPNFTDVDWMIQKDDLIGVIIPRECQKEEGGNQLCPSQINLQHESETCFFAFFHTMDNSDEVRNVIPTREFTKELVDLSMEVSIIQSVQRATDTDTNLPLIVGTVTVTVIALIGIVLACAVVFYVIHCRMKLAEMKMEKRKEMIDAVHTKQNDTIRSQAYANAYDVPLTEDELSQGYMEIDSSINLPLRVSTKPHDKDQSDGYEKMYDYELQEPYFEPANEEEELMEQLSTKLMVAEIPREQLVILEELGSGQFGKVFKGVWSHLVGTESKKSVTEEVAVKTLEGELTEKERIKFLQEAAIMAQFKHNFVVGLRGILIDHPMMIVLDLMKGGDLREYLRTEMREKLKTLHPLESSSILLSYMRQIALGMHHFAAKSYVHRDLAARNILVSEDGITCKIADFGLSRDLHEQNFYVSHGGKIPVKWTAPEALKYHKYSSASDIWSYGCVLYEIWSLGEKPFREMSNVQAMEHVIAGNRLAPPPGCPRTAYSIMIKCWHPNTEERPSFCDIMQEMQKSDFHILKWPAEEMKSYSSEAKLLGATLQKGEELYRDLQFIYLKKE